MGRYRTLLSIQIEHEFYAGRACPGVEIALTGDSPGIVRRTGLLLRPWSFGSGLDVLFDEERTDALCPPTDPGSDDAVSALWLEGVVRDPRLLLVTEEGVFRPGYVPHFDGERAVAEDDGRLRLHPAECASADQAVAVERAERLAPPLFTARLPVGAANAEALRSRLASGAPHYVARFGARRTYWKYYLQGEFLDRDLDIVDPGNGTRFESLGVVSLSNGAKALALRSTSPLALRERSTQHLQLRDRANGGRPLIARLPVADGARFSKESVEDVPCFVSEIYVHG